MGGDKDITKLPELIIEIYLKDTQIPELCGNNNFLKLISFILSIIIKSPLFF